MEAKFGREEMTSHSISSTKTRISRMKKGSITINICDPTEFEAALKVKMKTSSKFVQTHSMKGYMTSIGGKLEKHVYTKSNEDTIAHKLHKALILYCHN